MTSDAIKEHRKIAEGLNCWSMLLTTLSECEESRQACAFPRHLCAIGFLAYVASYFLEHFFNGLIGLLHGANQMLGQGVS